MLHPFSSGDQPIFGASSMNTSEDMRGGFVSQQSSSGFVGLSVENQLVPATSSQVIDHSSSSYSRGMNISNDSEAAATKASKKKADKIMKKPKYAFQTRSQVDILDDGYRWRKYGQKAVKNNKYPRSYYRCTHQGCNVKKQVQRLTKDEGVVVTTYEGMHTHPIEKPMDNFEHILSQMRIYSSPS